MHAKIVTLLVVVGVVFAGASLLRAAEPGASATAPVVKETIGGKYQWNSPEEQKRFAKVPWDRIATERLSGFAVGVTLVEKKTEECAAGTGSYLRSEGALCRVGVWLEEPGKPGQRIDSVEKLKARFVPIESEAEAVSFVAATGFDLKMKAEVLEGHVLAIDNGYLVQVVAKNTFGCRAHIPTGVIFKVTRDAKITQIAAEQEPEAKPPVMCVD